MSTASALKRAAAAALEPARLLPVLLGLAVGAAGVLQGLHWRGTARPGGEEDMETQLRLATEENAALKREIETLRAQVAGGAALAVPQEFIDEVERAIGLKFREPPQVQRVPREDLRERIAAAVESRFGPAGLDLREEAYAYIGWLGADHSLFAELTAATAVGARVWFDDFTGEGWVPAQFRVEEVPDQAALLRLLTRILLHQHFPPPSEYPGDDADRARVALHQGLAATVEERHYGNSARAIGFVPPAPDTEAVRMFASLSPFVQGLSTFAGTVGRGRAMPLFLKGPEAIHTALRTPPQTTRAVILPDAPTSPPTPLELPAGLPTGDLPGEFLSESAGQLGLRLWLEPVADPALAAELADHWTNDRYQVFADGDDDAALLWDIELDAAAAVERMLPHALRRVALLAGSERAAELGVPLVTAARRHLLLVRPFPTRLRFLHTASAATAGRWANAEANGQQ
jgi:hypothetical protein